MKINTFKESLPFLFKANVATMVVGHHGIGKSQAVAQYASEEGYEFIDLRLGTQDVGDLLGLADFERDDKGNLVATKFMRPDWFPVDPDSKGIIFMDEINRARRDVLQAVFQLVLDKKLHRYELPKGWHVIAAMNPNTDDYIVTDLSDKAFLDRFCHIKLTPSKQEFFKHANDIGVSTEVLAFLKDQPELIQSDLEEHSLDIKPSRRSWMAVDRLYKEKPPVHILQELLKGLVGVAAATAFVKSLSDTDKPITGKEIADNYSKYKKRIEKYSEQKTGGRMDLLKFTCDSLEQFAKDRASDKFDKKQASNIADFLHAIPKDLSFNLCRELYMVDCMRPIIDDHTELLTEMANKRKMKVDGLNN